MRTNSNEWTSPTMSGPRSLLVVDDDREQRRLVAALLRRDGHRVVEAGSYGEGVARFRDSGPFHLIMVDVMLPTRSGLDLVGAIRRIQPSQAVVVCSALDDPQTLAELAPVRFLAKPFEPSALLDLARTA
jgi:CheY-like chemotaxis protein